MATVGLSAQVVKNYREKRSGSPFLLITLGVLVTLSRVGYAITIDSLYILIPDAIGAILICVQFFQFFEYRKKG